MPNAVQTLSFSPAPTAGTYTITLDSQTTSGDNYNDDAATIQAELEALSNIGGGNVLVSGEADTGTIMITFTGALGNQPVDLVSCDASGLTAQGTIGSVTETAAGTNPGQGSVSVVETQAGVAPTGATATLVAVPGPSGTLPDACQGAWYLLDADSTNIDEGTADSATWTSVGTGPGQSPPYIAFPPSQLMMLDPNTMNYDLPWDGSFEVQNFVDGTDGTPEIQTLTVNATGGQYCIPPGSINYVPWNDNGSGLQAVLNSYLGSGVVSVSGSTVTWNAPGPQALIQADGTDLTLGSGTAEVQTIPAPSASGGTFTITGPTGDYITGGIPYDDSASDIQSQLNALTDIASEGGVVVSGNGSWVVAWTNSGPQSLLTVDGTDLTVSVTATASTTQQGIAPAVNGSVLKSAMISCERACA